MILKSVITSFCLHDGKSLLVKVGRITNARKFVRLHLFIQVVPCSLHIALRYIKYGQSHKSPKWFA